MADENQQLIEKVFAELQAKAPDRVRYMVLRLGDGSFFHFVIGARQDTSAITGLPAFRSFQEGIKARCIDPPQAGEAILVGNYRMLGE